MESGENFKPHISAEEAINICNKYATIDVMYTTYECYCKAYKKQKSNEVIWKQNCGLAAVYVMGFISGSRAVRKRKQNKATKKI